LKALGPDLMFEQMDDISRDLLALDHHKA
jgi:hypothetical protein